MFASKYIARRVLYRRSESETQLLFFEGLSLRRFMRSDAPVAMICALLFFAISWLAFGSVRGGGTFVAVGIVTGQLLINLTRTLRISLSASCLTVEWRTIGIKKAVDTFSASSVPSLHYVPFEQQTATPNRSRLSAIQINDDHGFAHNFAFGISRQEAEAVISSLQEFQPSEPSSTRPGHLGLPPK